MLPCYQPRRPIETIETTSRPDRATEPTCSSTYREAGAVREAREREVAREAEGWVLPKRHSGYAGPREHCPRPRPPDTRCGKHSCPIGRPDTGHPDPYTGIAPDTS